MKEIDKDEFNKWTNLYKKENFTEDEVSIINSIKSTNSKWSFDNVIRIIETHPLAIHKMEDEWYFLVIYRNVELKYYKIDGFDELIDYLKLRYKK